MLRAGRGREPASQALWQFRGRSHQAGKYFQRDGDAADDQDGDGGDGEALWVVFADVICLIMDFFCYEFGVF